jgi:hypothetical protein
MGYRVRNLYVAIRATMLAKINKAGRDFRIVDPVELRATDGEGLGGFCNRATLPSVIGLRASGSGAVPKPPISV